MFIEHRNTDEYRHTQATIVSLFTNTQTHRSEGTHTKGSHQQPVPLSSWPIKRKKKCQQNTFRFSIGARAASFDSWKESGIRFFFVSVNFICCSPPLLPTYTLSFIFLIPPSWHLVFRRVLHSWGIEFTQIKNLSVVQLVGKWCMLR